MREEIPKIKASLDSLDMPEDVKAAERTMQESLMRRERIFTLLTEAEMPIHTFLKHLNPSWGGGGGHGHDQGLQLHDSLSWGDAGGAQGGREGEQRILDCPQGPSKITF